VGSRTITWGTRFKWANGTPPVLSSTPNAVDIIKFVVVDAYNFYGVLERNFS